MVSVFSGSRESAREDAYAGDQNPGLSAGDGRLEVLCQAATASEPGEGALDHPALWLGFERSDALGAGHDFDRPFAQVGKRSEQFWATIDPVGEDVAQLGEPLPERSQQRDSTMIVLDV